ncbi:hypothetical protein Hanom_Chr07g00601071 [Helianthus anomalus]
MEQDFCWKRAQPILERRVAEVGVNGSFGAITFISATRAQWLPFDIMDPSGLQWWRLGVFGIP